MNILLINVPHTAIGSRMPREHLPPLGLLSIAGPLVDAGHQVELFDGEFDEPDQEEMLRLISEKCPQILMLGHSGSSSAHPTIASLTRRVRATLPGIKIIYGGVFPTYHFREVLESEPQIDYIVRGEGERIATELVNALEHGPDVSAVAGIAYLRNGAVVATPPAKPIEDLDSCRVAWELIDLNRYSYYGHSPAVVMQFSRGCDFRCTFCGQHNFWKRWRHRDPRAFAKEIAWLHRTRGLKVVNLADEHPTADREAWQTFLEALIAEEVDVKIIGSMRADSVVRDADILHLYRKAGCERFLLGLESTDDETLERVRKESGSDVGADAVRLFRKHGIISLATWVADFEGVTDRHFFRSLRRMLNCDPDQITALFATPHWWTGFGRASANRRVVQLDQRFWDYKHQVLDTGSMSPWRVILWVKFIEVAMQARPKALWRTFFHPDRALRAGMQWYARIGRRVWIHEVWSFLFREGRVTNGPVVREFWTGRSEEIGTVPARPAPKVSVALQAS